MQWDEKNPGAGDTDTIRARSSTMNTLILRLDHVRTQLRAHRDALTPDTWNGDGGDAFRQQCQDHLNLLDSFIDSLAPYCGALLIYATEVDDIAEQAHQLSLDTAAAHQDLTNAGNVLGKFPAPGKTISAQQIRSAQTQQTNAKAALSAASSARADLVERRTRADNTISHVLGLTLTTDWATTGTVLLASGITRPEDIDSDAVRDAMIDLTALISEGDTDAIDDLRTLLTSWGDNPVLMRDYLNELGPSGLIDVLNDLDNAAVNNFSNSAGDLQAQLRRALSTASSLWDQATADTYATCLVQTRDSAVAVAYLFADPDSARVNPRLVHAVADAIQTWEQEHDSLYIHTSLSTPTSGMAADLTYRMLGEGTPTVDPADTVFRHLAADPTATLTWLADDSRGKERAAYWYGQRPWHEGGGYNAPMLAWEQLQTIPGAIIGPDMNDDLTTSLAEVNAKIIRAWAKSGDYYTGYLDEEAAISLAKVLEAQMPIWAETATTLSANSPTASVTGVTLHWLGLGGKAVDISGSALSIMLGQVSNHPEAQSIILDKVKDIQARMITSAGTRDFSHTDALERIAGLNGIVDGAQLGNELSVAAMQDRTIERLTGIAGLGAGEIPYLGGIGGSALLYGGQEWANNSWSNNYNNALDDLWAHTGPAEDRTQKAQAAIEGIIDGWVPAEVIHQGGQSREQFIRQVMNSYEDNCRALDPTKAGR